MLTSSWACQELTIYIREMGNWKNQKQPAQQSRANDQDTESIEFMNTQSSAKHVGMITPHDAGCCPPHLEPRTESPRPLVNTSPQWLLSPPQWRLPGCFSGLASPCQSTETFSQIPLGSFLFLSVDRRRSCP